MKKLKPGIDPVALMKAVKQCDGDVFFLSLIHISEPTRPY